MFHGFLQLVTAGLFFLAGLQGFATTPEAERDGEFIATIITCGVMSLATLISAILVLYGAIKMLHLRSYGWAIGGSILAMVPCNICLCTFFGLPIGIWALVTLKNPEIRHAFQQPLAK
jgi:hypothetical protein